MFQTKIEQNKENLTQRGCQEPTTSHPLKEDNLTQIACNADPCFSGYKKKTCSHAAKKGKCNSESRKRKANRNRPRDNLVLKFTAIMNLGSDDV
jgi:hypothetical protein